LTGSGPDIGISPIIGHESRSDIIQPENMKPLHLQPSGVNGTNSTNRTAISALTSAAMKAHERLMLYTFLIMTASCSDRFTPAPQRLCYSQSWSGHWGVGFGDKRWPLFPKVDYPQWQGVHTKIRKDQLTGCLPVISTA
jgi:hypothetical protein